MFEHPYLPTTNDDQNEMLSLMGRKNLEELFNNIPPKFRLQRELDIPESHPEFEVLQRLETLARRNTLADSNRVFLGAGVEGHYIPTVVPALATRSEFLTSYTSYQPEISQGMLQTLFEYQSLLAELLHIDVVNSSMYDMASALAEAFLMAARVKKQRKRVLVPGTINPTHLRVINTYAEPAGLSIEKLEYDKKTGLIALADLESKINEEVAGVYLENPSYLGFIEPQVDNIEEITHEAGSLLISGVDIMSLGLLRSPGSYGADIVVAEGQSLGTPLSYGGPLLGVFGCTGDMKLIRQLPGRLVGMTRTLEEPFERGFVLTLSPREQHIRREKATSNICSNQALIAVTAAIYVSTLGRAGFQQLGKTIAQRSHYAAKKLESIDSVTAPAIGQSFWKEFVVAFDGDISAEAIHKKLLQNNLHGGKILTNEFPDLGASMLFCVTEVHNKETIDKLADVIQNAVTGGGNQ